MSALMMKNKPTSNEMFFCTIISLLFFLQLHEVPERATIPGSTRPQQKVISVVLCSRDNGLNISFTSIE